MFPFFSLSLWGLLILGLLTKVRTSCSQRQTIASKAQSFPDHVSERATARFFTFLYLSLLQFFTLLTFYLFKCHLSGLYLRLLRQHFELYTARPRL